MTLHIQDGGLRLIIMHPVDRHLPGIGFGNIVSMPLVSARACSLKFLWLFLDNTP